MMTKKNRKIRVLVGYPLSADYRRRLEALLGCKPVYLSVTELRRKSLSGLLRALWTKGGGTMLIAFEDTNSLALRPVLETLAAASSARDIQIIHPNLNRSIISRAGVIVHLGQMLTASVASKQSVARCRRELMYLLGSPRIIGLPREAGEVLYLKTNLWFGVKAGGSVGHIAGVVNGLLESGYGVTFASAEEPVMLKPEVRFLAVQPPAVFSLPSELNYYRFQEMFTRQVSQSLEMLHPAFIYQRLSVANYAGVVLSRQCGVPLVLEYNGSEAWIAKHWGNPLRYHDLAMMAEDASLRHAHLVVTISDVLRDELLERGVEPERIVVYPNCVDPELFNPERFSTAESAALRKEYSISEDAVVVTFVGTFGQWHGAEILAQAIRKLAEEERRWIESRNVKFVFVGDGLKMPEVKKEVVGTAAAPYVTLTGLVEQNKAPSFLAASDILVSPHVPNADGSRFFGSPTKLFEYMAMARGIVASELEQIGDVLSPGLRVSEIGQDDVLSVADSVALLTKPGDVDELARGIRLLVENRDARLALGKNARNKVLKKYCWRHHVDKILSALLMTK